MTKVRKTSLITLLCVMLLALTMLISVPMAVNGTEADSDALTVDTTAVSGGKLELINSDGATDYTVVYAVEMQVE